MSSRSNFYVTLPSNGSSQFYKNTASSFRNHLADPLELDGQWEVALVEMQYPLSWKLITKENKVGLVIKHDDMSGENKGIPVKIDFKAPGQNLYLLNHTALMKFMKLNKRSLGEIDPKINDQWPDWPTDAIFLQAETSENLHVVYLVNEKHFGKSMDLFEITLPIQYYQNPFHVAKTHADTLIERVREYSTICQNYHKVHGKDPIVLDAQFDDSISQIRFESDLSATLLFFQSSKGVVNLLGFPDIAGTPTLLKFPIKNKSRRPLLKHRTPAVNVYTDIIDAELVGDAKVKLLRAVGIEGEMGHFATKEFIRPYYKPVTTNYINSILIELKDDTGKDLDFTVGKVICKLHFRRCGLAV